jgi:hypothetical protein
MSDRKSKLRLVPQILAALVLTAAPAYAAVNFTTTTLGAGPGAGKPNGVAAGLFNADARQDLVIANKSTNTVSFRMGDGLGGFSTAVNVSVGSAPLSVATGDCDGDGDTDVFVANNASDTVTVLRNNGTGVFTSAGTVAAGNGPFFILASDNTGQKLDFNNDGVLDLVVADRNSDKLTTLQGTGNCAFAALQSDVIGGNAPESIAAGNFDNANRVDLAVADRLGNVVTVLRSTSNGLFPTGTCANTVGADCRQFPAGEDPSFVVTRDFNGDGNLDLAVTNAVNTVDVNATGVNILLGQGNGAFGTAIQVGSHGKGPEALVADNFTADAIADIVVINKPVDGLASLQGVGNGTFTFVNSYVIGNSPEALVAAQFNSDTDSNLDVVTVNSGSNDISTCLGQGNGTFVCSVASATPSGFGNSTRAVGIGDLGTAASNTPDNNPDVIAGFEATDDIGVYLNDGTGTTYTALFTPPVDLTPTAKNPRAIATGDWNSNGTTDIAIAACGYSGLTTDKLVVVFDRNFAGRQNLSAGDCPTMVKAKDLDGDGAADLVVTNFNSNTISVFKNNSGTFALVLTIAVGTGPTDVAFGDFGSSGGSAKDGKVDLAVVNSKSDNISILFGTGSPGTISFAAVQNLATLTNADARGIDAHDFNSDNIDDLVVVNHNTGGTGIGLDKAVAIRLGFGGLSFDSAVNRAAGKQPTALVADEVSTDTAGLLDLVVTNEGSSDVSILEGRGDATLFDATVNFKVGTGPRSVATGDLNNDLNKDIVSGNFVSDDMTILINNSPTCGDSVVEAPEQCDPPGTVFPTCPPTTCGPTCRIP